MKLEDIDIPVGEIMLKGNLIIPQEVKGIVLFAHGAGSSRFSPRNQHVAAMLNQAGLGTLLMDLLTEREEAIDMQTGHLRFDVEMLSERLVIAAEWVKGHSTTQALALGYFGSSTGAAAALIAAAKRPENVAAVVSRGGRPDLAEPYLSQVMAPVLLIVGGRDVPVIQMNQQAMQHLRIENKLEIIPGATHLFEEPGALDKVAELASNWFTIFLR